MYPYEYSVFDNLEQLGSATVLFLAVYFGAMLFAYGYSLLVMILHSLGLYTIAQRRGIHRPWLAWIPFGNLWILGSIADQYRFVAKGEVKNRRKVLLGINIALCALLVVILMLFFVFLGGVVGTGFDSGDLSAAMIIPLILIGISSLAILVLSIILVVFQYICYYNLFESCDPKTGTVFLVLGILFDFLLPFFVFFSRKKDLGMPPRRARIETPAWQPPQQQPVQPAAEVPVSLPEESVSGEAPAAAGVVEEKLPEENKDE